MFNQKYFVKILGFAVVSFTATFLRPMAPNASMPQYFASSRAAQLGLGQQAGAAVDVQLPKAQMSSEKFKNFEQEFMQPAQTSRLRRQSVGSGMFKGTMPRLMSQKEAYKIMGLSEQATIEQKKAAYRELAKKYHPDIAGAQSTAKMQELQAAYDLVKNQAAHNASSESTSNKQSSGSQQSDNTEQHNDLTDQLYHAIRTQNVELVRILLEQGANPDGFVFMFDFKQPILKIALERGNYNIVKLLLDAGAKNNLGEALREAIRVGRLDLFDLLVLYGALVEEEMFNELMSDRFSFGAQFDDRTIKLINSKVFSQVCEKNPKLITDSIEKGYRIYKSVWRDNLDKISYDIIPTLLYGDKDVLSGLTANDVRAWYAKVNKSTEKNEKLEENRQLALKAMRDWCRYEGEPYEKDWKYILDEKIRATLRFFNL